MRTLPILVLLAALSTAITAANAADHPVAGADERTPSRAQYFSWIDNTNEGATAAQTLTNLAFFAWLKAEYGMQLDIYAWDAGNLDTSGAYGTMQDERFRKAYPDGWKPIADAAAAFGCRMGLWGGPDGFGDTPQSEQARIDLLSGLCRDYHWALFKFDGVCGTLRPEKQNAFMRMIIECRKYSPNLILLNHRLPLGKNMPYATTFLWEGAETYIDVHMANDTPATHHRATAMARGLPPMLQRLTEDHGVCLSSCLDHWDDDLVLQAFNRGLILAPEIYGSPWFLRDDEFAKLARIFNLHRRYRDILVDGMELPEDHFGPHAVSRGNATTRLITLRNLTWEPVRYTIPLDGAVGLEAKEPIEVRRLHPSERIIGRFTPGQSVTIEVAPFRALLLLATTTPPDEPAVEGCDYELVQDVPVKPARLRLLGEPGSSATVTAHDARGHRDGAGKVVLTPAGGNGGGIPLTASLGQPIAVHFPGTPLVLPVHRKLADLTATPVPADAEALYEATCFAADNNALELRSLARAGSTVFPAVQASRNAFLTQEWMPKRGCSDRYAFDGDPSTLFRVAVGDRYRGGPHGATSLDRRLRIDLGSTHVLTQLVINGPKAGDITEAEVSADLRTWTSATVTSGHDSATITLPSTPVRYVRLNPHGCDPAEISAGAGVVVDRSPWRASNLFTAYAKRPAISARTASVTLNEAAPGSRICIALHGKHGRDGAWAAVRSGGTPIGCPDRAVSFDCNPWEYDGRVRQAASGYTYYLPVTAEMIGKPIDLVVLTLTGGSDDYRAEAWISPGSEYRADVELQLER
ncbi:MAG TPA: discoidin domain-containing protein [Planctomycetota bacterium]|nr:discoidin domain-containing protein [Planctomycetota bacterium]